MDLKNRKQKKKKKFCFGREGSRTRDLGTVKAQTHPSPGEVEELNPEAGGGTVSREPVHDDNQKVSPEQWLCFHPLMLDQGLGSAFTPLLSH